MGGRNASGKSITDLLSIDLSSDIVYENCDLSGVGAREWETLAPITQPRAAFACVAQENYIYAFGGSSPTAEKYNIDTNEWESLPNLPGAVTGASSALGFLGKASCGVGILRDKIFVIGESMRMWSCVFDILSKQRWESQTIHKYGAPITEINNENSGEAENVLTPTIHALNDPRCACSVVAVDGFLIAIGGKSDMQRLLTSIEVFPDDTNDRNYASG